MLLHRVKQTYGDRLDITWRHFSLEQVNSGDQASKVWETADITKAQALVAQVASEAAKRQDPELFERFHLALMEARHGGKGRIRLNDPTPILALAAETGLDADRLREDMADPAMAEAVGRDHTEAVDEHGVFGTPTFVFEDGAAIYLKTLVPPEEDSIAFFEHFAALAAGRRYMGEMKRPQPPWPRGA